MNTYRVGSGNTQITFAADIDTVGLAASRAIVLDINTNDPEMTVGVSVDATGDISRKDVGTCDALTNKRITVLTKIDLIGNLNDRKKEAERLGAKYILDEGPEGSKAFTNPIKAVSKSFTDVKLFIAIDLIP